MRNNSTKQKGKKISSSHYRSKFRAQRYGDKLQKKLEIPEKKKAVHTMPGWCQKDLPCNFIPKEDRPANACDVETTWIIADKTKYKDPAPKTLDELRQ